MHFRLDDNDFLNHTYKKKCTQEDFRKNRVQVRSVLYELKVIKEKTGRFHADYTVSFYLTYQLTLVKFDLRYSLSIGFKIIDFKNSSQ